MTADLHAAWRKQAACRTNPALFDDSVGQETKQDRAARHRQAAALCATCPVLIQCHKDITVGDEGIRAGKLLATYDHPAALFDPRELEREHGTARGYKQHIQREDMPACGPCTQANRAAARTHVRSPELRAARMARASLYRKQPVTCQECGLTIARSSMWAHKKLHAEKAAA